MNALASTPDRYNRIAVALHWTMAIVIIGQLVLGWWMLGVPKSPPGVRAWWFNLHKSIGLILGLLIVLRMLWRAMHPVPALPGAFPAWQRALAAATHAMLYLCMLVLPVTGYLGSSFTKYPVKFFGIVLPHWGWDWPAAKSVLSAIHYATTWTLMFLIVMHVIGAFWHLLQGENVFRRMLPAR